MFWLASATKALTAMAAMKAVELGLIELDQDITPLVLEMADQPVFVMVSYWLSSFAGS